MSKQALGLIETVGMAAAMEAADTCIKSANVQLIGYELSKGGGLVTVKIQGDVGAVKSAVDAAKISASRINEVFSTLVIPRPAEGITSIIQSNDTVGTVSAKKTESDEEIKSDSNTDSSAAALQQDINDVNIDSDTEIDEKITIDTEPESFLKNVQEEVEIDKNNEEIESKKDKKQVCNLCKDPECPRRKGQPRELCIHYKAKKV